MEKAKVELSHRVPVARDARVGTVKIRRLPTDTLLWYQWVMPTISETAAFERGVRPVLTIVLPDKPEELLRFRPDPELQARIEELAAKSTDG